MRLLRRKRRSYVERRIRADFLLFLKQNPVPVGSLVALAVGVSLAEHWLADGWAEGFIQGSFWTLVVAASFVAYLIPGGGAFQLAGAWGESATRDALAEAAKRGWIWGSVHNVELDGSDIDHILVAPGGVFAVETKWRFAALTPGFLADCAWQASQSARKTRSVLRSVDIDQLQDVTPLVVIWGKGQDGMPDEGLVVDGVRVMAGVDIRATWLEQQRTGIVAQDNAEMLLHRLAAFAKSRVLRPVR